MLLTCRCHSDFQQFLRERLPFLAFSEPERLLSFSACLARVCLLNLDPAIPFLLSPSLEVNKFGIPRCPAGYLMVYNGFDKKRSRLKWRCPLAAGSKRVKREINCPGPCSPSPYGRTVYTKPHDDLRLFTQTPRNSLAWKKVYANRSACERSFVRPLTPITSVATLLSLTPLSCKILWRRLTG